ncbi:MAG: hypothetical protein PHD37_00295 [Gallionellaceae bacterium]|nr:hypothetical protein [Gallionellaceae bacterium]
MLFAQIVPTPERASSPMLDRLAGIDPDELSPKQALEALYELRRWNTVGYALRTIGSKSVRTAHPT